MDLIATLKFKSTLTPLHRNHNTVYRSTVLKKVTEFETKWWNIGVPRKSAMCCFLKHQSLPSCHFKIRNNDLDRYPAPGYGDESPESFQQFVGGDGDLYLERERSRLHPTCCVHRVSEQTEPTMGRIHYSLSQSASQSFNKAVVSLINILADTQMDKRTGKRNEREGTKAGGGAGICWTVPGHFDSHDPRHTGSSVDSNTQLQSVVRSVCDLK